MTQVPNLRPPSPHSSRESRVSPFLKRVAMKPSTVTTANSRIRTDSATQSTSVRAARGIIGRPPRPAGPVTDAPGFPVVPGPGLRAASTSRWAAYVQPGADEHPEELVPEEEREAAELRRLPRVAAHPAQRHDRDREQDAARTIRVLLVGGAPSPVRPSGRNVPCQVTLDRMWPSVSSPAGGVSAQRGVRLRAGVAQELVAAVALVVLADAGRAPRSAPRASGGSRGWARAPRAPDRGPSSRCGAAGRGCGGSRPGRRRRRSRRRHPRRPGTSSARVAQASGDSGCRRTTSCAGVTGGQLSAAGSVGSRVGGGPAIRSRPRGESLMARSSHGRGPRDRLPDGQGPGPGSVLSGRCSCRRTSKEESRVDVPLGAVRLAYVDLVGLAAVVAGLQVGRGAAADSLGRGFIGGVPLGGAQGAVVGLGSLVGVVGLVRVVVGRRCRRRPGRSP